MFLILGFDKNVKMWQMLNGYSLNLLGLHILVFKDRTNKGGVKYKPQAVTALKKIVVLHQARVVHHYIHGPDKGRYSGGRRKLKKVENDINPFISQCNIVAIIQYMHINKLCH